ncbi:MAG: thiamine diphosphokinase [Chloroflexi bacterium 13_1_40CM_4_68_4]|nr:MAG: thiamine diphosphokinase [Chloroflexi bacterium 13_1_40CM_4_68_4]
MKTVVVGHGDVAPEDREEVAGAEAVIAADGGALALERWGITPQLVVGDLDSLGFEKADALGARGAKVIPFPAEKDESDLELAMRYALETGADEIVLVGVFGGRLDHLLANAMLIADPVYRGRGVRAVHGRTHVRAVYANARVAIESPVGTTITLLPVHGDATGVRTRGLRYTLAVETLRFGRSRGLSNVVSAHPAWVSIDQGVLLLIEIREGGTA